MVPGQAYFCSPGLLSKLFGEGRGSFIRLEPVVWELWGFFGFYFLNKKKILVNAGSIHVFKYRSFRVRGFWSGTVMRAGVF